MTLGVTGLNSHSRLGGNGSEFANFYQIMGTSVTLVEFMPGIVPNEDEEVSKQLERSFRKLKIKVLTSSSVESADTSGEKIKVSIKTPKGIETVETDIVLSAVGVTPNIEDIGLETANIKVLVRKIERRILHFCTEFCKTL